MKVLNHLRSFTRITTIGVLVGLTLSFGSLTAQSIYHGGTKNFTNRCGASSLNMSFASQGAFNQGAVTHTWYISQTSSSSITKTVDINDAGVYVTKRTVFSNSEYWVQPYVNGLPDGPRQKITATFNSSASRRASISVNQLPTSTNPAKWLNVCNEGTLRLTGNGGRVIDWRRGGTTIVQTGGSTYTPTQDGTYTARIATPCAVQTSSGVKISFLAPKVPTVSISLNNSRASGSYICSGSVATYTATTNTNVGLANYIWSTGESGYGLNSIQHTLTSGLTVSVTVNNADYCVTTNSVSSSNFTTNVHALPVAQDEITGGGPKVCPDAGNQANSRIGIGLPVVGRTYYLRDANDSNLETVTHPNPSYPCPEPSGDCFQFRDEYPAGNYTIRFSDSPCSEIQPVLFNITVTEYDPPTGALRAKGGMTFAGPVCLDEGACLQAPTGKSGYEIHRVTDAGATDDIVSQTSTYYVDNILDVGVEGQADVRYYAKYKDRYPCSQSYQVTTPMTGFADVRQLTLPNAVGVSIETDAESGLVCGGGTAIFNATTVGIEFVQSYNWTVGGVNISSVSNATATGNQLQVINMTGPVNVGVTIITTDCLDPTVPAITATSAQDIYPIPTLTVSNEPVEIFGAGNVTMLAGGTDSFTWHDAQGTQIESGDISSSYFDSSASFKLKGTDGNACLYEKDFDVTVKSVPQLTLSGNNFLNDGTPPSLTMTNTTGIYGFTWYKDGNTIAAPSNPITQAGSYKVVAEASNGGATYETPAIHIYQWANAPRSTSGAQTVSEGAPASSTATAGNYVRTYTPITEI